MKPHQTRHKSRHYFSCLTINEYNYNYKWKIITCVMGNIANLKELIHLDFFWGDDEDPPPVVKGKVRKKKKDPEKDEKN